MAQINPVRPTSPRKATTTKKPGSTSTSAKDNKKSGSGGSGGSGGSSAEKRAVARANAEKKKAGKRYLESAANLELQAKALRHALKIDFAKSRDNNLGDVGRVLAGQLAQLKLGHAQRSQSFLEAADNTEKATAATLGQGTTNLVRERQDSMSSLLEQGAGETDTMRTMLMAARNWYANAQEANRAYFDSNQSINAGIVDLNIDTRSSMANAFTSSEAERDRLWQDFYNRRSESFTQLGNIKGQQADYYAQAKEMGAKPKKGAEKAAEKEMEKSFMDASKEAGKTYTQKGLPNWIADFKGQRAVESKQANTNLAAALTMDEIEKAEGATLRKWAA